MPTIRDPAATSRAVSDLAIDRVSSTQVCAPNGLLDVRISDDVHDALERSREPGESDDDLVTRVVRFSRGTKAS